MPATDSSSSPAAAPLASIGRSIGRSLRRDHHHNNQIHSIPHPHAHPHPHPPSDLDAADAFQRRAADLLTHLGGGEDADLLSLAWTTRLLDAFLLCLEDFRALLFGSGAHLAALSAAPLGEAQIRRARKALTDLTILMLQDTGGRESSASATAPSAAPPPPRTAPAPRDRDRDTEDTTAGAAAPAPAPAPPPPPPPT